MMLPSHSPCYSCRWQALPAEARARCEDPESSYNFGWSHGKEALAGGRPDVHKGSYYANPLYNEVTADPELMRRYPAYCRSGSSFAVEGECCR